jgi:uncharacterized protein DUF402
MLMAVPVTVVCDRDDLVALYLAPGSSCMRPVVRAHDPAFLRNIAQRTWKLEDRPWTRTRRLALLRPNRRHMVSAFWSESGDFEGWYVDLIEPARRTAIGFDLTDLVLDVVIGRDLSWQWKDEDEFAEAQELGLISRETATEIEAEGRAVIDEVERGDPWWVEWKDWAPDPTWPIPAFQEGWDRVS